MKKLTAAAIFICVCVFMRELTQDQLASVYAGARRCLWSKSLDHFITFVEIISIVANCVWGAGRCGDEKLFEMS